MEFDIDINDIIKTRILILFYAYKKEYEGDFFIGNKEQLDEIGLVLNDNKTNFVINSLVKSGYLDGKIMTTRAGKIPFVSGITDKGQKAVEDIVKKSEISTEKEEKTSVIDKVRYCIKKFEVCTEFIKVASTIFADLQLG